MPDQLRLLAVTAHPDDESLGLGGLLARYAREGVETSLVTATRGQRGRFGAPDPPTRRGRRPRRSAGCAKESCARRPGCSASGT